MPISQSTSAPLFVVLGATGGQGRSIVRAIEESSTAYRVRAVTRDASKPAAKALETIGCSVVAVSDIGSVEGVRKAFEGADVVFAVTMSDYSEGGIEREYKQGKAQMDAAKAEGVKTVVWSGLPDLTKLSNGKHPVEIFEVKDNITVYGRSLNAFKLLDVQPGSFASNYFSQQAPRKTPEGQFILSVAFNADTVIPIIDIDVDYGAFVLGAIEHGVEEVHASAEYLTPVQIAEAFTRVSGKQVTFVRLPDEQFQGAIAAHNVLLANRLLEMFQAISSGFGYYAGRDLGPSNKILSRPARTFEETLRAKKEVVDKVLE